MNNENEINTNQNVAANEPQLNNVQPYQATKNINTVVSNNEVNVNNTLSSNFQGNGQNIVMPEFNNTINNMSQNVNPQVSPVNNNLNQQVVNQNLNQPQNSNDQVLYDTTNSINNRPLEKKKKKATMQINSELKFAIILALVLLIAMMFIPTIFDFIDDIKLKYF